MKRRYHRRYAGLFAAIVLLLALGALFTWLLPYLSPAPRAVVQLGYQPDRLIFSPDGRFVATTWSTKGDGGLDLCDLKTGKHRMLLQQSMWIKSIAFSPDGSWLAADDRGLTIWDVKTGETVVNKAFGRTDTHLSPDWRFLFYDEMRKEDEPHQIIVLDLETQQHSRIEGRLGYDADVIQFAPDGKRFALIQDKYDRIRTVQIWGLTPEFGPQLLHEREFVADTWAITQDLTMAATVVTYSWPSKRSWVQLWDLETGVEKACYLDSNADATIKKILFTCQGQYLVGKYREMYKRHLAPIFLDANSGLEEVRLFAADGERLHDDRWELCLDDNNGWGVLTPAARGAGDRWMLCVDDHGADVWDMHRRKKQLPLWSTADTNITKRSDRYSFSEDGRYLLVCGFTDSHTDRRRVVGSLRWGTADTTETNAVSRLWDVERAEEIASYEGRGTLSLDGKIVVTYSEKGVCFWDVPPGQLRPPVGLILATTLSTWGLLLLACWVVKRRLRRWRRPAPPVLPPAQATGP